MSMYRPVQRGVGIFGLAELANFWLGFSVLALDTFFSVLCLMWFAGFLRILFSLWFSAMMLVVGFSAQ